MEQYGSDERTHYFFKIYNDVIERAELTLPELGLYTIIAKHINNQTKVAFPSRKTLATLSNVKNLDTIDKHLKSLVDKGYIKKTERNGTSCLYSLIDLPQKTGYPKKQGTPKNGEGGTPKIGVGGTPKNGVLTKRTKKTTKQDNAHFESFWIEYPNKKDKQRALKLFEKCLKEDGIEVILNGTKSYAREVDGTEKRFIKHPSTFLNNKSYLDYEMNPLKEKNEPLPEGTPDDEDFDIWGDSK